MRTSSLLLLLAATFAFPVYAQHGHGGGGDPAAPPPSCWPGHVVDHRMPLACGGADAPSNMQWQTTEDAKARTRSSGRDVGDPASQRQGVKIAAAAKKCLNGQVGP